MGILKRYIEMEQTLFQVIHIIRTATGGDLEKLMTDPRERLPRDGCSAPAGPHPCWPGCSQTSEELVEQTRFRGSHFVNLGWCSGFWIVNKLPGDLGTQPAVGTRDEPATLFLYLTFKLTGLLMRLLGISYFITSARVVRLNLWAH